MILLATACKKDPILERTISMKDQTTLDYRDDWRSEIDFSEMGEAVYDRLQAFEALSVKEGQGLDFFYDNAFPNGAPTGFPSKDLLLSHTRAELQLVLSVPYDEYLNLKIIQGALTEAQKDYLIDWYNALAKLDKQQASDATYISILTTFDSDVVNDNSLSISEKTLLRSMVVSFKYTLQYFQDHGAMNFEFSSDDDLQARSGCSLKNVLRIFRSFSIIIGFIRMTGDILWGQGSEIILQDFLNIVSNHIAYLSAFVAIIECILVDIIGNAATWLWSQISSGITDVWCFLFGCEEVDCNGSFNVHPTLLGCNSVELTVHGAGADVTQFLWVNDNALPATATTTTPLLAIAAVNPSLPVTSIVTAICSDNSDAFRELIFTVSQLSNTPPPSITIIEGPTTVPAYQTFRYYVSQGAMGVNALTWSAASGGSILQTGPYWADISFWRLGTVTVTATMTNTCSSASASDQISVQVNPQ